MNNSRHHDFFGRPFVMGWSLLLVLLVISQVAAQPVHDEVSEQSSPAKITIDSAIVKLIDSVHVPAELPGVIATLDYREGQMVKQGEEIARIKSEELALRLKRAEIEDRIAQSAAENDVDVRYAKKSIEVSTAKVTRSLNSNQRVPGVVPIGRIEELQLEAHRDELGVEQAIRDLDVASMQAELAKTDLRLSQLVLQKSSVLAPIDGMIVLVERKPGEWVEPGDPIVRIVRMDRLKIEGAVPASVASQIRIGDPAIATVNQPWLQGTKFNGKVLFINPEANPVNSMVQVWIEIENKDMLLIPGLETTLTIELSAR